MVNQTKLNEMLRLVREKIRNNPEVLKRFDKDGNGTIDGEEWEQVRQLAIRRLERLEREEQAATQAAQSLPANASSEGLAQGSALALATAEATQTLSSEIVEEDLAAASESSAAVPSIATAQQLILEEQGSIAKVTLGRLVRRKYEVKNGRGQIMATIEQQESEFVQNLTHRSLFEIPDLNFHALEPYCGKTYTLTRSRGMMLSDQMEVINAKGAPIATVRWKFSLVARTYELSALFSNDQIMLKQPLLRPFTMLLYDDQQGEIGKVEKGWAGLGAFLTGGNRMRIVLSQPRKFNEAIRWAMLAACLLEDLKGEDKSRSRS